MSLPLSVPSQSGPPKSVGGGGREGRGGGGGVGGVVYHTSTGQYIGVATFFFFRIRVKIGRKIDYEWSRRSEMFGWGSFLGVVATTLIRSVDKFNIVNNTPFLSGQFAKKHAKIGIVEQKISTIEDQTSDKSAASTRTHSARSSAKSRKASSARSNRSSKVQSPRQVDSELKVEKVPKVNTSQSKEVYFMFFCIICDGLASI